VGLRGGGCSQEARPLWVFPQDNLAQRAALAGSSNRTPLGRQFVGTATQAAQSSGNVDRSQPSSNGDVVNYGPSASSGRSGIIVARDSRAEQGARSHQRFGANDADRTGTLLLRAEIDSPEASRAGLPLLLRSLETLARGADAGFCPIARITDPESCELLAALGKDFQLFGRLLHFVETFQSRLLFAQDLNVGCFHLLEQPDLRLS